MRTSGESSTALAVESVVAGYVAGIDVIRVTSLPARAGPITILIGPNGAGKSTLLKTIFGFMQPRAGSIRYRSQGADVELAGLAPHRIKALGIGYIPQQINIFPSLSVEENLRMGGWILRRRSAAIA